MSDLTRMELIEMFFNKVENNSKYNIGEPNYFKFWEGWVDECWKGLYLKPEYKGLDKIESINKVIKERFPRIGEEFGYKIKDFSYFKHKGKFIMKVVFSK